MVESERSGCHKPPEVGTNITYVYNVGSLIEGFDTMYGMANQRAAEYDQDSQAWFRDQLRQLWLYNTNMKHAQYMHLVAKGTGTPPDLYDRPFPGTGGVNKTTVINGPDVMGPNVFPPPPPPPVQPPPIQPSPPPIFVAPPGPVITPRQEASWLAKAALLGAGLLGAGGLGAGLVALLNRPPAPAVQPVQPTQPKSSDFQIKWKVGKDGRIWVEQPDGSWVPANP